MTLWILRSDLFCILIFLSVLQPCKSLVVFDCTTLLTLLNYLSAFKYDGLSQHVQYPGRKSENMFIDKFHHHRSRRNADSNAPSCKVNNCTYREVRFVIMSYSVFLYDLIFWNGSSISQCEMQRYWLTFKSLLLSMILV